MRKRSTVAFILVAGVATSSVADAAAETGAFVLTLPQGSRGIGMGEAQAAVAEGADAIYWNPAALAAMSSRHDAAISYSNQRASLINLPIVTASYAGRIDRLRGAIAASFTRMSYGQATLADDQGRAIDTYTPYEAVATVAIGGRVADGLSLGLAFKLVRVYLSPERPRWPAMVAHSPAIDAGMLWRSPSALLSVGVVIQNVGRELSFNERDEVDDPLPRNVRLGLGSRILNIEGNTVTLACDLEQQIVDGADGPRLHAGGELSLGGHLATRFGWTYDGWYYRGPFPPRTRSSLGAGVGVRVKWLELGYANRPMTSALPDASHYVTVRALL